MKKEIKCENCKYFKEKATAIIHTSGTFYQDECWKNPPPHRWTTKNSYCGNFRAIKGLKKSMNRQFTKEESQRYLEIVREGNMDKMYDFGYEKGEEDAKETIQDEEDIAN